MWSPTHVQVTVQRAQGLIKKGKQGTNDAFVTIALGKEKFQTSVKEKGTDIVEWHEKCELQIPKQGNKAEIILTVLHHTFMGIDEFLGSVHIPLAEMDVYERPRNRWYKLKDKPGKEKNKERGELEVKISFTVKAGSLSDLSKKEKHKSSLGQLSHALGGSLISISSLDKRRGFKKLASKIGKIGKGSNKKDLEVPQIYKPEETRQTSEDADPGVISEVETDDEFALDELSQKGSGSSLNFTSTPSVRSMENSTAAPQLREISTPPAKPPRTLPLTPSFESDIKKQKPTFDFGVKESIKRRLSVLSSSSLSSTKEDEEYAPSNIDLQKNSVKDERDTMERIIIGKEISCSPPSPKEKYLNQEIMQKYSGKSKKDLIEIIADMQSRLDMQEKHQKDLEEYIDDLLLRVMENSPRILQNPYINCKAQAQFI